MTKCRTYCLGLYRNIYVSGCRNPDLEFQCASGNECIPIYDMCNGIPQCQDGSDENPTDCPSK